MSHALPLRLLFVTFFSFVPCIFASLPMSWPPAWRTLLVFLGAMTFCFSFFSFGYSPPFSPVLGVSWDMDNSWVTGANYSFSPGASPDG
ncbi:hypothetical protein BDV38DRAFT_37106 [Aspergillus pseudotamarii]|uniref:Uncharacterized protein n=1 Tax=Aspergillus pseudotamarii TaxID=132259 RepID=A0A5N6S8Q2_ASPPS|nr:uncharacterized protein BDV38DRAFT_37106 [Aspergillus pseudotamarii]KAE8131012.1 hypothetical protein BDV38DRAFT_37106 [Aspergillus pseudotamarii]